jgi:sirohydrochlorin cobaltochelatase
MPQAAVPVVLVAFGTREAAALPVYDAVATDLAARFPEHPLSWAFTSRTVRAHRQAQGLAAPSPVEAVAALRAAGYRQVVVQSLHISPGQEFNALLRLAEGDDDLLLGAPLLNGPADSAAVLDALTPEFVPGRPTLVVAHGNARHPPYNRPHLAFGTALRQRWPDAVLASLEGEPGPAPLDELVPRVAAAGRLHVVPLLLVDGGHVRHDVLGHQPTAWRARFGDAELTCAPPLGANPAVRTVVARHLAAALALAKPA